MSAWDDYFETEKRRLARQFDSIYANVFEELNATGAVTMPVTPPPTRAETILECWRAVGPEWDTLSADGGLIIEHDLGIIKPIYFQRRQYGDQAVVEAEGVIVHRF